MAGKKVRKYTAIIYIVKKLYEIMPPKGVKSPKRKRQYEHIKQSALAGGRSERVAERIAAATTNKTRREKGETKGGK
jgi:hypothetical protein